MANLGTTTIYDLNKQVAKGLDPLSLDTIKDVLKKSLGTKKELSDYHMLLCHEQRDYTLFVPEFGPDNVGQENYTESVCENLMECIVNRGDIVEIKEVGINVLEIWIKFADGEAYCYFFFPNDKAIVKV